MRMRHLRLIPAILGMMLAPALFAAAEQPTFTPADPREDASLPPLNLSRGPSTDLPVADVPPPLALEEEAAPPTPPTTPPIDPPSEPPTTPETETGPVTVFGPRNLLAQRYRSRFPPVVHVQHPDGEGGGKWTAYAEGTSIKMIKGHLGKPFITFKVNQEAIEKASALGASMTPENKIELVRLFSLNSEKPFGPAPAGTWLKQPRLLPIEKRMMQIGRTSARIRWLFNKVELAPNQAVKIFWGLQIKILTLWSNRFTEHLLNDIWEEIDGELDRGQIAIVPGRNFDLFCNVVGMHVMYHDDDLTSYSPISNMIEKRLKAELLSLDQYPPPQAEIRKAAIEKRLAILTALEELLANG